MLHGGRQLILPPSWGGPRLEFCGVAYHNRGTGQRSARRHLSSPLAVRLNYAVSTGTKRGTVRG